MTSPQVGHSDLTDAQRALRAADADREQAANLLRDHCAHGRITADELSERLDRAYRASYLGELHALFADLPTAESALAVSPRRPLLARLPRRLTMIPILAGLVALGALTGAHVLWFAWPALVVWRLHRLPGRGRGPLTLRR